MENESCPDRNTVHDAAGLRVVRLDAFSAPHTLPHSEQEAYTRRFSTILIDESRCKRGGVGHVVPGKDAWGLPVAIKFLDDAEENPALPKQDDSTQRLCSLTQEEAVAAFRREYETLRALSDVEGFPTLYGKGRLMDRAVILTEWIKGETLMDSTRRLSIDDENRLSPLTAAQIGRDLFALIARMSAPDHDVVHRDISPANIMIDTSRRSLEEQAVAGSFDLRLVDFGSATLPHRSVSLTQKFGVSRGATPDFAPPEMLTEDLANIVSLRKNTAIDVYAAAGVLYLLLAGRPPFDLKLGNGVTSYYLQKMDQLPRSLISAHMASPEIHATLHHEPQTRRIVELASSHCPEAPSAQKLAFALSSTDSLLGDVVFSCLNPIQEFRPRAARVSELLSVFVNSYGKNIESGLMGQPPLPCLVDARTGNAQYAGDRSRGFRMGAIGAGVLVATTCIIAALLRFNPRRH